MKKILVALLSLTLVLGLAGCGNTQGGTTPVDSDTSGEGKYKVVYSIPGLSAPIWTAASEGFKDKAAEYGWEAEILDPNDDLETQISQLENALVRGANGAVITPIDGEAVSTLMGEYENAGVPVIAIDRQVTGTSLATVEADNYNIGKALGEMYLETLGDQPGKVLIVGGPLSSSATVNRTEGFKDAISGKANVEIVAESATEMDSEVVLAAVTNYLQANPDINAIMSCTDYILPSVITALDEAGKLFNIDEEGHVNIYSVDGDGYGLSQVANGNVDATYGLDPYEWAASAVEALKAHFEGGSVDSSILIGGNIVTIDNIEELKEAGSLWGAGSMDN
ncbi:MAG: sugar ABC transporter substrate-binding protein [Tissierella sp.]|nr:sugar ABC transporter substrate-binding protein [Tissierella sp.]